MDAALLPVKRFDRAKQRLAPQLDADARASLARALFEDALDLAVEVGFVRWWVVSDESAALQAARARGLDAVEDTGEGLNEALRRGIAAARADGATSVTIVASDLPLASPADLRDLLDTGGTSDVVVVPSEGDGGTNALYLRPPELIAPRFGRASLRAHVVAAERRALRCSILALPRLGLDVDTHADIERLLARRKAGAEHTMRALRELKLG